MGKKEYMLEHGHKIIFDPDSHRYVKDNNMSLVCQVF